MKRPELTPLQAEKRQLHPDWVHAAKLIAQQDGCSDFPVDRVKEVLRIRSRELVARTFDDKYNRKLHIQAAVPDFIRPFKLYVEDGPALQTDDAWEAAGLTINPSTSSHKWPHPTMTLGGSQYEVWYSEPSYHIFPETLDDIDLWQGPTEYPLAVGNAAVSELFEELAEERYPQNKRQLFHALFNVARLNAEFGRAPLIAPSALESELEIARSNCDKALMGIEAYLSVRADLQDKVQAILDDANPLSGMAIVQKDVDLLMGHGELVATPRFTVNVGMTPDVRYLTGAANDHYDALQILQSLTPK